MVVHGSSTHPRIVSKRTKRVENFHTSSHIKQIVSTTQNLDDPHLFKSHPTSVDHTRTFPSSLDPKAMDISTDIRRHPETREFSQDYGMRGQVSAQEIDQFPAQSDALRTADEPATSSESPKTTPALKPRVRNTRSVPPSDPHFNRDGITDKEYIELLLFEIKELRGEMNKTSDAPSASPTKTQISPAAPNEPEALTPEAPTPEAPAPVAPVAPLTVHIPAKDEVEIPLRSARRRRNSPPPSENEPLHKSTSQMSGLSKSVSIVSSIDNVEPEEPRRIAPLPDLDPEPTVNDSFVSVKSTTSNDISRTRSNQSTQEALANKVGYSAAKNQSTGSFQSYKSRIKLPISLQQQQDKREKDYLDSPSSLTASDVQTSLKSPIINESLHDQHSLASSSWQGKFETPPTQSVSQFSAASPDDFNRNKAPMTPDGFAKDNDVKNDQVLQTPNMYPIDTRPSLQTVGSATGASFTSGTATSVGSASGSKSSFQVLHTPKQEEDDSSLFIKPKDFQTIDIIVQSTITMPTSNSKRSDEPNVTIVIRDRESAKEMWRIRKTYSQLSAFDNEIRPIVEYFGLPALPEKVLFLSTSPAKIEQRRTSLQNYFNTIFLMPHIPHMVLFRICRYLSLDFVNPLDDYKSGARKEGFLIRRYKGLGTSWKIRWCQVDGPSLEIYEVPGGPLVEQIRLKNCQIGRQSSDSVAEDKGYRHAFLVMESQKTKLSNSYPKHFFCAENDEERDEWVDVLLDSNEITHTNVETDGSVESPISKSDYPEELPSSINDQLSAHSDDIAVDHAKKMKKRYFPFRRNDDLHPGQIASQSHNPKDLSIYTGASGNMGPPTPNTPASASEMQHYLDQLNLDEGPTKSVFGRSVQECYQLSNHEYFGRSVPSIVFRCLDYLTKTGAIYEEGIFRLSGSASTIRQLKEQFNAQFDIDLFESPLKPDMHTVAGLFKAYLRELPNPITGIHTYNHLNQVILQNGKSIPPSSLATIFRDYLHENVDQVHFDLCFVIFKFLRQIIGQSQNNRMNLRNVCIVFVPTLNISLEVLSTFLVDFECIFEGGSPLEDSKREVLDLHIPNF